MLTKTAQRAGVITKYSDNDSDHLQEKCMEEKLNDVSEELSIQNNDVLKHIFRELCDCNLNKKECAYYFERIMWKIKETAIKMACEATMDEKTEFPIILGQFENWENLLKAAGHENASKEFYNYLSKSKYELTKEKTTKVLKMISHEKFGYIPYFNSIFAYLSVHKLKLATFEDFLIFDVTYKKLINNSSSALNKKFYCFEPFNQVGDEKIYKIMLMCLQTNEIGMNTMSCDFGLPKNAELLVYSD